MRIVYEPAGKAGEYSPLACNLRGDASGKYGGCSHACTYCYCPQILKIPREQFFCESKPKPDVLKKLEMDAKGMAASGDRRRVQFQFIGDPYCPEEQADQTTRRALEIIARYGLNASVLTKGGMMAARDFDIMVEAGVSFGTTLTCQTIERSREWEPNAAQPANRKFAIWQAHEAGIFTWVSLEPALYPNDSLSFIPELADCVDFWHVGRLNYQEPPQKIDWPKFAERAWELLVEYDCSFRFKDGLAKDLRGGRVQQWRAMVEAANQKGDD